MNSPSSRRPRTRGGLRGRGRGMTTRGGRDVQGRGRERPTAVDNIVLMSIDTLPLGTPLERPLHVKKKGTCSHRPSPPFVPPTIASCSGVDAPVAAAESQGVPFGSPAIPPSPFPSSRRQCTRGGLPGRGRGVRTRGGRGVQEGGRERPTAVDKRPSPPFVPPTTASCSGVVAPVAAAESQGVPLGSPAIPPSPLRPCTRGGLPERGRGVRTRGGRGVQGGGRERPTAVDNIVLMSIDALPLGTPLERPLHVKKKRTCSQRPSPPFVPPTTASCSGVVAPVAAAESQGVPLGSPAIPPSPFFNPSSRRPCTRGGLLERGRGVRTRGGRGVQGGGRERPTAVDNIVLRSINALPLGSPLERPLHHKKKRTRSHGPSPPFVPPTTASGSGVVAPVAAAERQGVPLGSPPSPFFVDCGPSLALSMDTMSSGPASSPVPSTSQTPDHARQFSVECGPSPSMSSSPVPSTSQVPDCAGQLTRREQYFSSQGPALTEEIMAQLDMGSEAETSDSDYEPDMSFGVPLARRQMESTMETSINDPANDDSIDNLMDCPHEEHETPLTPYSITARPTSMFEFEWRSFPDSPIPPESRRETFSQSNVGPTLPVDNPYDAFTAIWDRPIVETIVRETNRYAQYVATKMIEQDTIQPRSRICSWYDTTVDEIYLFLALILTMGVVVKSSIEEYWSKANHVYVTPGFQSVMTLRRFQMLCKCLHFSDNASMIGLNLDSSQAKLFKIAPIIEHMNIKFKELYVLDRNIAVDESLLQWKGWLNINQHIPNKKAKIGIKSYELCESQTGYLWNFEFHAHQRLNNQSNLDPISAPTPAIVLRLVQGLENKGYTLWMDNYYNSPALARKLKTMGFDCVGTLRTNAKFVPEALTILAKTQMQPGQITGFTSGDVDLMVWRDHKQVGMISTYHGNSVSVVQGKLKPILISDYNVMMGGVDKKDQMLSMYPIERKRTKIWYKKVFRRLLNVSVLNAYIIYRGATTGTRNTHREFRLSLINSLIERHSVKALVIPYDPHTNVYDARAHFLNYYPMERDQRRIRRTCVICKRKVSTFCMECEKTVCLVECFVALHN